MDVREQRGLDGAVLEEPPTGAGVDQAEAFAGDPDPPTVRQIGEILAGMLGWNGRFVPLPPEAQIGQTPFSVPYDFTVSMAGAQAIGYRPAATYPEALRPYLAWMQANAADWKTAFPMFGHYPSDPFDYAAEDAVL